MNGVHQLKVGKLGIIARKHGKGARVPVMHVHNLGRQPLAVRKQLRGGGAKQRVYVCVCRKRLIGRVMMVNLAGGCRKHRVMNNPASCAVLVGQLIQRNELNRTGKHDAGTNNTLCAFIQVIHTIRRQQHIYLGTRSHQRRRQLLNDVANTANFTASKAAVFCGQHQY